jgi:hypothetical protein
MSYTMFYCKPVNDFLVNINRDLYSKVKRIEELDPLLAKLKADVRVIADELKSAMALEKSCEITEDLQRQLNEANWRLINRSQRSK